jgi:hypothetical protein
MPQVVLPGHGTEPVLRGGLVFTRTYRASPERIMQYWSEPERRAEWLSLPSGASFTCLAQVFPTSLRAHLTDGVHSAQLELLLRSEDDLTSLNVTIVPYEPLTRDRLIAAGYDDHWEELLYVLADVLMP